MVSDALLDAAQAVLVRDGYVGTTIDAVAEFAGVEVDTVTEAFGDKERMFLAVVDRFLAGRRAEYDNIPASEATFEAEMRSYGRSVGEMRLGPGQPEFDAVLVEFWIHASRGEPWRTEVRTRNTSNLDLVGAKLASLAAHHGMEFILPPREVARSIFSLGRGMGLEVAMDGTIDQGEFEEMFWALIGGLARPAAAGA